MSRLRPHCSDAAQTGVEAEKANVANATMAYWPGMCLNKAVSRWYTSLTFMATADTAFWPMMKEPDVEGRIRSTQKQPQVKHLPGFPEGFEPQHEHRLDCNLLAPRWSR